MPRQGLKLIAPGEAAAEPGVSNHIILEPRSGRKKSARLMPATGAKFLFILYPGFRSRFTRGY